MLQRFVGYALTRDTSHEIALWLNGPRGSGKSTFIETVTKALGEMAGTLGLARIEASQFALADIPGRTLLTATEQPAGHTRATHILNALISGELLDIEQKHKPIYSVRPVAKLLWAMNDAPRVSDPTSGIFRRIRLVDWPARTVAEDTTLKVRLAADLPAVLNWAVQGLRDLRAATGTTDEIFAVPPAVRAATTAYEHDQDSVRLFREEVCYVGERVLFKHLYSSYRGWCHDNGFNAMNSKNFAASLERLGHVSKRSDGKTYRMGLTIYPDDGGGRRFDSAASVRDSAGSEASCTESRTVECRMEKPRSGQKCGVVHDGFTSYLDSEQVNGAGRERAMEKSRTVVHYSEELPANSGFSTARDPARQPRTDSPVPTPADIERVADYVRVIKRASIGNICRSTGLDTMAVLRAAATLTQAGRVTSDRGDYVWSEEAGTPADDLQNAAFGILRDVGYAVDVDSWRYECEVRGYHFEPNEFREIVEDLVAGELVRAICEDSAVVEERYMEDPDAWGDECLENPPIYEVVDM